MVTQKKQPVFEESALGLNPFMVNEKIKARKTTKEEEALLKFEGGIYLRAGTMAPEQLFEERPYAKVFEDVDYRDIVLRLPYEALRLYTFIQYQIRNNKDWIWLNYALFKRVTGLRKDSEVDSAVDALERYGFISSTKFDRVCWVNSMIFFKGNRLKKYALNVEFK